jgi:thiosulfate/3-mercaptopyruvate sulfurtransferase
MPNRTKLPLYRAQVLRMWIDTRARHPAHWRFSLEDVGTGVRSGFADLDALIGYLQELMDQLPDQSLDTETISQQRRPTMNTHTITNGYAYPEMLVETEWVAKNLYQPNICLVEVDVDTSAYEQGHIPGAVGWNWRTDTQDQLSRDILSPTAFAALMERSGISNDTTVILYGDNNNWFAAYALWMINYYGHTAVRLMNGGRAKWLAEGRELTTEQPQIEPTRYTIGSIQNDLRALRPFVEESLGHSERAMVDVRSPDEYSGKLLVPANLPQEGSQRGGHIPGAASIPWATAVREDGCFKSRAELEQIYGAKGVIGDKQVITYCRIGERSSHTWFALKYLLGYSDVRNYDGSWTEWGSAIGVPIERS